MSGYPAIISQLAERLKSPLPGRPAQELMTGRVRAMPDRIPENARASAVLALLFPKNDELHLLFIRRTEDGHAHSGQISFPGGRQDPEDADLRATAIREAQEEVGLMSDEFDIIGPLSSLYIPVSNFQVFPYVGFCAERPEYNINEQEVAYTIEMPLSHLFDEQNRIATEVRPASVPGLVLKVPAYELPDKSFIWGATAMMLSELEVIWKELDNGMSS